jgi:hypothetical protein
MPCWMQYSQLLGNSEEVSILQTMEFDGSCWVIQALEKDNARLGYESTIESWVWKLESLFGGLWRASYLLQQEDKKKLRLFFFPQDLIIRIAVLQRNLNSQFWQIYCDNIKGLIEMNGTLQLRWEENIRINALQISRSNLEASGSAEIALSW